MPRQRVKWLVAAAACVVALLTGADPAGATRALGTPGAPGTGDPYYPTYGNGGYDVGHYDVRVRYRPDSDELTGTTTLLARATQDLSQFNLDFGLTTTSVRVNNRAAAFSASGHELTVTPAREIRRGGFMVVTVEYRGHPDSVIIDGINAWRRTADGEATALGEPEASWWWFPANDHPLDKATYDISVFVPEGTEAISNGVMPRPPFTEAGWTRWNWRENRPMITYLAFVAIGEYEILTDTTPSGRPIITAYSTKLGDLDGAAKASIERTAEATEFLVEQFGEYPFTAEGGVVPQGGFSFALETQTRPVYAPGFFARGSNMYVVVHEMAHQWFGDSVAVHGWRDIWLNEGFATYAEWLWSEAKGEGTAQELFDFLYSAIPADDPFWQVKPGDPGPENQFDGAVYDRGAMTLHALRTAVGDDAFFATLRAWVVLKKFGNATIEEFIALAEQTSGQQLDELFQTWLFTAGKPVLAAAAAVAPAEPKSHPKIAFTHSLLTQH